jgi:hypothetical protein
MSKMGAEFIRTAPERAANAEHDAAWLWDEVARLEAENAALRAKLAAPFALDLREDEDGRPAPGSTLWEYAYLVADPYRADDQEARMWAMIEALKLAGKLPEWEPVPRRSHEAEPLRAKLAALAEGDPARTLRRVAEWQDRDEPGVAFRLDLEDIADAIDKALA